MRMIRLGAGVLNQTPMDWNRNAANIVAAIRAARARQIDLLCLPELCVCGYGCEDAFYGPALRRTARQVVAEILPETEGLAVTLGLPVLHQGSLFNACVLAVNGRVAGLVAKQHLAGDGLHYEPRWFRPWPAQAVAEVEFNGQHVPMGDLVFDLGGVRVGFEICEDAWVAHRPGSALADRGVDLILNPSASHFAFGKYPIRRQLVADGSRAFGVAYVYSNLVGNEAGRTIYDGGALLASLGTVVAQGPRFTCAMHHVTDAVIDVDANRLRRAQVASRTPDFARENGVVRVDFAWRAAPAGHAAAPPAAWEKSSAIAEEEFARAIGMALLDYAEKSRSDGFVVSLSGGADSSAVACLVRLGLEFAAAELGMAELAKRLRRKPAAGDPRTIDQLAGEMLTTIYQSTRNSSPVTREAARQVANAVGARHLELDVDELTQQYVSRVQAALGRPLTWERDDIALQNIQARVRAPGAWLVANVQNALLLATSNRSEAAVGYATMDGDTCGGISPIAGIDKAFLRRWLVWLEREGPAGLAPIPALRYVNAQQPTAELRPPDRHQTDEDDLMPYDVLDAIEDEAIGQKRSPAEALAVLGPRFTQYSDAQLRSWIERFYTLWCRNQWKRERYAPSFHVDDKNLDPKTWCRFPILSGSFQRELAELDRPEEDGA